MTLPDSIAFDSQSSASSDDEAETRTLGDSITDYPVLWDRRYHKYKEGSYPYPNDQQEARRMDWQYSLIKKIQGGRLHLAPLADPRQILDIGTGTGIWCIEMADSGLVPHSQITGIDLSPIQPEEVPENVYFEVQDCSDSDWDRPLNSFDLIHSRILLGSLQDFSQYIRDARKYLKPGSGWLECCELNLVAKSDDGTVTPAWGFAKWEEHLYQGSKKLGRSTRVSQNIARWLKEAGYVDITEHMFKIPIGGWPANKELKEIGKAWAELCTESLPSLSYKTYSEGLGWSREQIEVFLADARKALQDKSVHAYHLISQIYARRPTAEEEKIMGWMAPPPLPRKS